MRSAVSDLKLCGLNAVLAQFRVAPDSIERLLFDTSAAPKLAAVCKSLAARRKPYRLLPSDELARVAETEHHGGVVAVVRVMPPPVVRPEDLADWAAAAHPLLLLDRVGNPHNLGAIARTAAFLGLRHLLLADDPLQALPSAAAHRVAEGGLAHLDVRRASPTAEVAAAVARRWTLVAASLDGEPLPAVRRHLRAASRPIALILGNEEHGVDPALAALAAVRLTIPGSGLVQSLNVAAAAAVLGWSLFGPEDAQSGALTQV